MLEWIRVCDVHPFAKMKREDETIAIKFAAQ